MYGIIDFSRIDTKPGAPSAFAPPAGWNGDGLEQECISLTERIVYRQLMRQRWKTDPGVRQHVAVDGRMLVRGEQVVFCGRFADEARRIAEAVWKGCRHDHMA